MMMMIFEEMNESRFDNEQIREYEWKNEENRIDSNIKDERTSKISRMKKKNERKRRLRESIDDRIEMKRETLRSEVDDIRNQMMRDDLTLARHVWWR